MYLKTLLFELREQAKVKRQFYPCSSFRKADHALMKAYKGMNPYMISKGYLQEVGASNLYQYGETPLTTMHQIVKECGLGERDTVIEMGAGRGRAALFLAEYVGCKVIAYEQIPLFVEKMVPSKNLTMLAKDMMDANLSLATAIFLYGTMLEDEAIGPLIERFPKGVKVITVSYPLSDYRSCFETKKQFSGRFPWGETEVYLNERTC